RRGSAGWASSSSPRRRPVARPRAGALHSRLGGRGGAMSVGLCDDTVSPVGATAPAPATEGLAEVDRLWLARAAEGLRVRLRRTVREVVEAGRVFGQARRRLGRTRWRPWLATEAQIPVRSASRLIAVGKVFGSVEPEVLDRFTPTSLYTLSEPGVPQSLREYA